ncbi:MULTISPECIES: DUF4034 domain-containing protein [unclassified Rhizobacter]|uniref:DUF4034 domain-containing protein n=1 Tax=unclassified Rhizobacter TaxID=2640088 RepID=UPI0006F6BF4D|nr:MULTISPECIES: DUF4034 domain-containing protein [unclassified Rhizobacter]KQU80309.1 hypothetical protein ASC88_16895 [Rhizobacter sp. Root29]KQW13807.1 hypothetical protein ASC98_17025 [Rhizobacter sp. Root1238]KRB20339.1 hypothetical protein ASE08_22060 [Rhizobacter sp. Root16D2]
MTARRFRQRADAWACALALVGCVFGLTAQTARAEAVADCMGTAEQDQALQRLQTLYRQEQFAKLDAAMACLMTAPAGFSSGKPGGAAVYWMFRRQMPAPGADPMEAARIARWRQQLPASMFAEFAGYRLQYANAWDARGMSTADRVGQTAWASFDAQLTQAEAGMLEASAELRGTPIWHTLLLAVVQDMRSPRRTADAVFQEGIGKWPDFYDLHELRLTRLVPRWGGSWETVDAAIDRWAKASGTAPGGARYAQLYLSVLDTTGTDPRQTRLAWPRMKAGLEELVGQYPDPAFKNAAASIACVYGDVAYHQASMRRIAAAEARPAAWIRGTSPAACAG